MEKKNQLATITLCYPLFLIPFLALLSTHRQETVKSLLGMHTGCGLKHFYIFLSNLVFHKPQNSLMPISYDVASI